MLGNFKRALIALLCLSSLGCAAKSPRVRLDAEDQFSVAEDEFIRHRYRKAAESFKRLLFEHPGSGKADEAQYLLAMCHYRTEDYVQAEAEFNHFILNYPDSPYADDAAYYVGMTHYKQMPSYHHDLAEAKRAVDSFSRFLVKYPGSKLVPHAEAMIAECRDRLAEKEFESGQLYLRLKKFGPAKVYLEYVVSEYSETRWAEEASKLLKRHEQELREAEPDTSQAEK